MSEISRIQSQNNIKSIPLLSRVIATGLFTGYSPIFPGTAGTLVGVAVYILPGMYNPFILGISIICFFAIGVVLSSQFEKQFGDDPQIVVIDEIVGIWTSYIFLPKTVWMIVLGIFLFRFFDIVKPPPIRAVEKLKNGFGIMLDDVVAGVYTNIILHILLLFIPSLRM